VSGGEYSSSSRRRRSELWRCGVAEMQLTLDEKGKRRVLAG
jgi:hypothetical protein